MLNVQTNNATEWRANWALVVTAMAGFSLSSLHAGSTGIMMVPIEAEFGWSRTQIYSGMSLVSLVGVALATFMGLAIDRIGARRIAIASSVLLCVAVACLSMVGNSILQWWLVWGLVGVAVAAMPTVWITPVASRFVASRGLAVAVVLSGSGISTFLVPIITHTLVQNHGWRAAYLGLASIWALFTLPLILLFFRGPARKEAATQSHSSAGNPAADHAVTLSGLTVRQGFASLTFYKLLLAAFASIFGGVALVMNLVPVLVSTGIASGSAATVAGLIGISTIGGRVAGGWLMDRMSAKVVAALSSFVASALPVMLLLFPGVVSAAIVGVVAYGLVGGAKVGAIAYLASRHLGARAFGTLYGTINAAVALAVAIAPLAANYVFDLSRSYTPVMLAAVPVLAFAAMVYLSLPVYPRFADSAGTNKAS